MRARLIAVLSILGFLLVWEAVARSGTVPGEYFTSPSTTIVVMIDEIRHGDLGVAVMMTFARALIGLTLAAAVGLGAALFTARYRVVRLTFDPVAEFLRPLPPAAIVPLAIYVLGLGWPLYFFVLTLACFWPIYLNASQALTATPGVQIQTARSFGYGSWAIMREIRFPAALPTIFIGVRQAAAIALIAAVATEMIAGRNGLGFYLMDSAMTLQVPQTFAALLLAMLSGIAMNTLVVMLRGLLTGWHDTMMQVARRS
jgi:ABC-type nitrate/sulfonate/bicarbonate transport system permease component